jgi:hypothetical protein
VPAFSAHSCGGGGVLNCVADQLNSPSRPRNPIRRKRRWDLGGEIGC